jgi:hypothetical protein
MGTGDFTIDVWVYLTGNAALNSSSTRTAQIFTNAVGFSGNGWNMDIDGDASTTGTGISLYTRQASNLQYNWVGTVTKNTWHHIAMCRSGTTSYMFFDGTLVGTFTFANQTLSSTQPMWIGGQNITGYEHYFPGYISNFRIIKGRALYTSSFTVPNGILPAVANTSLLLNTTDSINFIKDNGPNKFTVTNNNSATFNANGPFNQGATTVKQRQVTDGTLEVYSNFDEVTGIY